MAKYVLYDLESPCSNRARSALLVNNPDWSGDWHGRYFPGRTWETVSAERVDDDETPQGIRYYWELSGPDGAWFLLFKEPHHTADDLRKSKSWLRWSRDVTGIRVLRVPQL